MSLPPLCEEWSASRQDENGSTMPQRFWREHRCMHRAKWRVVRKSPGVGFFLVCGVHVRQHRHSDFVRIEAL